MNRRLDRNESAEALRTRPVTGEAGHGVNAGTRRPGRERNIGALLALGTIAHFALRIIFVPSRNGPVVVADEIGYLANARYLGGGEAIDLSTATLYRFGYSLLISPIFLSGAEPKQAYLYALTINAAIGAATFVALYFAVKAFAPIPSSRAVTCAFVGACVPTFLFASAFSMADAFMPLLITLSMLTIRRALVSVRLTTALGSALWAGFLLAAMWLTHPRGQVIVVLLGAAITISALGRASASRRLGVIVMAAACVSTLLAGGLIQSDLAQELYMRPAWSLSSAVNPGSGVLPAAGAALGQLWTLVIGTLGLAAVGLLIGLREVRTLRPEPLLMAGIGASVLAVAGGTAIGFSPTLAESYSFYGRYVDVFAPLLVAVGCSALARPKADARWWLVGAALAPTMALLVYAFDPIRSTAGEARPFATPVASVLSGALPTATEPFVDVSLAASSAISASIAALLFIVARRLKDRSWMPTVIAVVVYQVFVGSVAIQSIAYSLDKKTYPSGATSQDLAIADESDIVLWDTSVAGAEPYKMLLEYNLGTQFVNVDVRRTLPVGDLLITTRAASAPSGWELLSSTPEVGGLLIFGPVS